MHGKKLEAGGAENERKGILAVVCSLHGGGGPLDPESSHPIEKRVLECRGHLERVEASVQEVLGRVPLDLSTVQPQLDYVLLDVKSL